MKKLGQVEHFFTDAGLGAIILVIAFILTSYVEKRDSVDLLHDLQFKDSFDRTLLVFLQSPLTPVTFVGDAAQTELSRALALHHYTYGDLLYLSTLQKTDAPTQQHLFSSELRSTFQTVIFSPSQKTFTWQFNASTFLVDSSEGQGFTPSYLTAESSSLNISLYYPALPPTPLIVSWQQGEQHYVYA